MKQKMKPCAPHPELEAALAASKARWDAMTWDEQEAELRAQQQSNARQDKD